MEKFIVKWLGHSCFKLECGDWSCVVDPFEKGSVPGMGDIQESAIEVFCSHDHHDHNAAHLVKQLKIAAPRPEITAVNCFHDDENGTKRGKNAVHIFEYAGIKLAHFGDLGHILSREQLKQMGKVDVALIPVGGFYTVDAPTAKKVAEQIGAKIIIPMHYKGENFGFDVIAPLSDFTQLMEKVNYVDNSCIELTKDTQRGVYVLTPQLLKK